ncbi:MAG: galactokinase, partial [Bifidobacteriaceae bacterium]|nr:galactokinase [Bifidobacteriaceae bacterium]
MTEPSFLTAWSAEEGAARAAQGFRQRFGAEPEGVWAAPGRGNLIGEHPDYNGGLSLPIALPHRTYFAAAHADGDTASLSSAQAPDQVFEAAMSQVAPGTVTGWGAYAVGVLWALRRRALPAPALAGHVDSCVPFGAGLSSSAALEAAVALAAVDLGGDGANGPATADGP